MRKFFTLLGREIKAYFYSPIAYAVLFFFVMLTGLNFYAAIALMAQGPTEITVVEGFFNTILFWFPAILIFPLLTMRLFAEEFKMGTIETLMTAPVSDWQVVLSKFFGTLVFYIILWLPSFAYFQIFEWLTDERATHAAGAYLGSYSLLLLIGMFYISIGCLASALTKNQIVAAITSFCIITVFFFGGLFAVMVLQMTPAYQDLFGYFSMIHHMQSFSQGILDTRPVVFYLSMTVLTLAITHQVFQSRRWRF